jgi:hypothetical protein
MKKQRSTMFLRGVIFIIGLTVLALCIFVLPAGIRTDVTGYYRPILIGMYVPAIPFFIALYEALKLLSYIDRNKAFSPLSVKVLKNIKYCGVAISLLYTTGMPYIYYAAERDDAPGVIVIGLVIIFASFVIAVFAAVLEQLLHNAIALKSENDLTV